MQADGPQCSEARLFDPDTSWQAAQMAPEHRRRIVEQVHAHLLEAGGHGLTSAELAGLMVDVHPPTITRRVTQLVDGGKAVDSGRRRPTPRGAQAIVWVAVEHAQVPAPDDVAADPHAALSLARSRR